MELRFAWSASKHGISPERAAYVIEHCGLPYEQDDDMTLYLGDDWNGVALEVGAVTRGQELVVVHAMRLRARHRDLYAEVLLWRR